MPQCLLNLHAGHADRTWSDDLQGETISPQWWDLLTILCNLMQPWQWGCNQNLSINHWFVSSSRPDYTAVVKPVFKITESLGSEVICCNIWLLGSLIQVKVLSTASFIYRFPNSLLHHTWINVLRYWRNMFYQVKPSILHDNCKGLEW